MCAHAVCVCACVNVYIRFPANVLQAINELLTQLDIAQISVSASESVTRNDFLDQIHELKVKLRACRAYVWLDVLVFFSRICRSAWCFL